MFFRLSINSAIGAKQIPAEIATYMLSNVIVVVVCSVAQITKEGLIEWLHFEFFS
jgi:hypothetical protein